MKLLIDGDIIAYKAASAAEKATNWGDGLWTLHAWEEDVRTIIDEYIKGFLSSAEFSRYEVALSSPFNFRKDIFAEYKANRTSTRKPMLLGFARDYIIENHYGFSWFQLEADDVLGIKATEDNSEYVIWSEDKDLMTIHGNHLVDEDIVYVSAYEAEFKFYLQVLCGDSTDNYKGCPGVGPVSAEKILKKADKDGVPIWDAIVAAYGKQGLSEDHTLIQARMAYILNDKNYNRETGEILLWTPETPMP